MLTQATLRYCSNQFQECAELTDFDVEKVVVVIISSSKIHSQLHLPVILELQERVSKIPDQTTTCIRHVHCTATHTRAALSTTS